MPKNVNIQGKVEREILQKPDVISLGGETYTIAPPSFGTLVAVSSLLARLPEKAIVLEKGQEFESIISTAHRYGIIPRIIALLILGAKEAREQAEKTRNGILSAFIKKRRRQAGNSQKTRLDVLAQKIEDKASASELKDAVAPLLERLELKDFFVLTTFLHRLNVTKPTKVEKEATVRGRS